ncbi:MAG: PQQ-like beta-propeller repeat protein [Pirellulales bacterium]|nr:PQQ-like beta-propeller repeat protein [Pirellulales bacterium]
MIRVIFILLSVFSSDLLHAENWPQWRGPEGNGASGETGLPLNWSEKINVIWKCPLPPWGASTPAVWDDAVFVTAQIENGDLLLLRIDKTSGKIVWTRTVGRGQVERVPVVGKSGDARRAQKFHGQQNMASPSPATDGKLVVAHFGNGDLAAYDFDGRQLWKRNLQDDYGNYTIWWGHANSPVLYENLVISICLQDSCADLPGIPSLSYVAAHDKRNGREVWKTMRMTAAEKESCDSYVTPLLWKNGERTELVVLGGLMLDAYEPASGKQLWSLPDLMGNRTISGLVAAHGMIYATQGMHKPLLAVKPGGEGKRPRKDIVWQLRDGTPDSPTPVVSGDMLYLVTNDGIARCLDALSGRLYWKERLKGDYRASPLAADGRIYFQNTSGLTTVISAEKRLNKLLENQLDDETLASPIVSGGKIFIRGKKTVYCIGK